MKRLITLLMVCISIELIATACRPTTSETKWGILTDIKTVVLLQVPPKGKVTVCADQQQVGEYVAQAVLVWAKEIGRDNYMSSTNDCDKTNADVTLTVQAASPSECPTAQTYSSLGLIQYNSSEYIYSTFAPMLHEVGHDWGMCDQYIDGLWNCDRSVQNAWTENSNGRSVMGGNYKNTLAEDDIKGIKYIADMAGIGQNDAWKAFLADPNNNNDSTQNSDSKEKPNIFIKQNGRFIDIYVRYNSTLTYCIGTKENCRAVSNQRNMDSSTLANAGTVYKITYISPERITSSSPFNIYSDGKLIRSFYLK